MRFDAKFPETPKHHKITLLSIFRPVVSGEYFC